MSLRGEPKVLECFGTRTPPGTGAARQIVRRSWTAVPRADDASPPALLRPGSSAGVQIPPPLGGWNGSAGSAGKCPAARWTGRRRRRSNLGPGEQPRARTSASSCSQHSQQRRPPRAIPMTLPRSIESTQCICLYSMEILPMRIIFGMSRCHLKIGAKKTHKSKSMGPMVCSQRNYLHIAARPADVLSVVQERLNHVRSPSSMLHGGLSSQLQPMTSAAC